MPSTTESSNVVSLPRSDTNKKKASSQERIWGKAVLRHGYTGIPVVLIKAQRRLGITPLQMNIIIQLLSYWHDPDRPPFPSKKQLADRIGVAPKTIQNNIRELEDAGLIKREQRKTASGDWNSNIYHLDGLIEQIRKIEPDFAKARETSRNALRRAETPVGRRKSSS